MFGHEHCVILCAVWTDGVKKDAEQLGVKELEGQGQR